MKGKLLYLVTVSCISLMLIGCASTTIDTYKPNSPDEEAIIMVMKDYLETLQKKDLTGNLATFHDNASIMIFEDNYTRPIVSKKQFAKILPSRWSREQEGEYVNPKILVSGDKATVKCTHRVDGWQARFTTDMVKENGKWYIMKRAFGVYN